jgi:fatty-acyl-CoA synthase
LLISVDDGSDLPELPGAVTLDEALADGAEDAEIAASPDDLLMVCTGGTTGRPKGVMWRQGDIYVSSMNGADHGQVGEIHDKVTHHGPPWFAVSPLMHAAGMWTAFSAVLNGQTVVLHDTSRSSTRRTCWDRGAREGRPDDDGGDAYAGPIVEELGRRRYDLSALFAIGTGGAGTSVKNQQGLLEHLPNITVINGYGSSETGNMGFGHNQRGKHTDTFVFRDGAWCWPRTTPGSSSPVRTRSAGRPGRADSVGVLQRS